MILSHGYSRSQCPHCHAQSTDFEFETLRQALVIQLPRFTEPGKKNQKEILFDLFLDPPVVPVRYELLAVISHYGSSNSGHYMSFLSQSNKWVECDDSRIRPKDFDETVRVSG